MACTGIEFCKLAIVDTKERARLLVTELEKRFPELDTPITINVNGCPNACARTQVADIGLKGQLVMDDDGNQVEGFQVHLGGALGLQANFGRKLRAHKVTSADLDDYVTHVVTAYLADRTDGESFATWAARADEVHLRGEAAASMSERAVAQHCPYCGETTLWPLEEGWECRSCLRAFSVKYLGLTRPDTQQRRCPMSLSTQAARDFKGTHTAGRTPEELRELVSHVGAELELAPAENIIEWAVATFGERFCITSSMGDAVLAHLASTVAPGHRRRLPRHRLPLRRDHRHPRRRRGHAARQPQHREHRLRPSPSRTRSTARTSTRPTPTCAARCARSSRWPTSLGGYDAWATGLRRAETHNRVIAPVVGLGRQEAEGQGLPHGPLDRRAGRAATSPTTACWSTRSCYDGYPSIGCWPCTRRVAPGDDPRSGRWAGTTKTECGIHA